MGILTEKQIEYGFDYFLKDEPQNKCIVEVSEYNGENALTITCTQLGDSFTPQNIHVNSLDFLNDMKQLRFFRFLTARLKSKDYSPVLSLENVEHLTLRPCKEVKNLYSELIKLPKLKYGLLISKPELYLK